MRGGLRCRDGAGGHSHRARACDGYGGADRSDRRRPCGRVVVFGLQRCWRRAGSDIARPVGGRGWLALRCRLALLKLRWRRELGKRRAARRHGDGRDAGHLLDGLRRGSLRGLVLLCLSTWLGRPVEVAGVGIADLAIRRGWDGVGLATCGDDRWWRFAMVLALGLALVLPRQIAAGIGVRRQNRPCRQGQDQGRADTMTKTNGHLRPDEKGCNTATLSHRI